MGPLLASLTTAFAIVLVSAISAAKGLALENEKMLGADGMHRDGVSRASLPSMVNAGISLMAYMTNHFASHLLRQWLRVYVLRSRVALYHLLTFFYALFFASSNPAFVVIPILQSVLFTTYFPSSYTNAMLNTTLQKHGFSLIARQDSNTGYISVLDNERDGFRVMRCDHSLLGGEWTSPRGHASRLREPIYAIFVMLEAVRLVEPTSEISRAQRVQESALVVGLGIGTTPSALVAHGVDTTIVEIDPVVHAFASQYFNLPANHTSIIDDAVAFVERSRREKQYDYIIHDVFTGGAEPIDLFTVEFLHGLKDMLKPEGIIAINYAGDLRLRSASMVVRTVLSVFETCRLFREEGQRGEAAGTDFTNLVLFCRKVAGSFRFRQATREDFLGSQARQHHLPPRYEVDPEYLTKRYGNDIITKRNSRELEKAQYQGALGHWKVMRSVLPDAVWENW
ncbi:MAG: hypothetical protein Q9196_003710 [Gyalolechia fulgens]